MSQIIKNVGIVGMGMYIPEKVMTNLDFEKIVDTTDEWIKTRTGISQRYFADENTSASNLGAKAAQKALENANINAEDIDLIIVATSSPDMYFPSTACLVQSIIGANNAAAFDISAACSGFIYGVNTARQFIMTGQYKTILVIGTETLSKVIDLKDRNTCVLFGDGAGAAILQEVEEGYGILSTTMGADGSQGGALTLPACFITEEEATKRNNDSVNTIWMNGKEVFKFAVKIFEQATLKVLNDSNLTVNDVSMIVPHQANVRIIASASDRLGISQDKFYMNLDKYGNTSAASIPIALFEAYNEGKLKKGDIIVLVAFGGGVTWAANVIKWSL